VRQGLGQLYMVLGGTDGQGYRWQAHTRI
jgi:hypothetical protein